MKRLLSSMLVLLILLLISPIEKVKADDLSGTIFMKNMDINKDWVIDVKDLAQTAKYYNTKNTSTDWPSYCDFNNDGIIDLYDLALISKFIGTNLTVHNISDFAEVGQKYTLPSMIKAQLGNENYVMLPVKWSSSIADTSKAGTNTYTGTIQGYNKTITLTLSVSSLNNNSNINNLGFVSFDGSYVYYSNPVNEGRLSKANIDGSGVIKINDDLPLFINNLNGWIYYCNFADNSRIYKVKTDGTGRVRISNDSARYLNIYNGKLYYLNYDDNLNLYSLNTDGTGRVALTQDMSVYPNFYNQNIYYSNFSNYGEITRMNLDGTSMITLNNEASTYINAVDKYLYYINYDDKHIYRLNYDGSGKQLLNNSSCYELSVVGDWIYYINDTDNSTLHRLKTDGTMDQRLLDITITDINVTGGRIFLYDEGGYLESVKLDGTDIQYFGVCTTIKSIESLNEIVAIGENFTFPDKVPAVMTDGSTLLIPVFWNTDSIDTGRIGTYTYKGYVPGLNNVVNMTVNVVERGSTNGNNVNGGKISKKNDWIYFADDIDGNLYKIKSDGTAKTKLCDDKPAYINVVGNYIYYQNTTDNRIYKISTSGNERTVITSDSVQEVSVLGDWIFYINSSDNNYLYKVKTDGTDKTVLVRSYSSHININGNWIYYIDCKDNYTIYKISMDGTNDAKLYLNTVYSLIVYKDKIYCDNRASVLDLDGNYITDIIKFGIYDNFNIMDDRLYYTTRAYTDEAQLYTIKLDGTDNRLLTNDKLEDRYMGGGNLQILINDGWIYYQNYTDKLTYRIKSDGSGREMFGTDLTIKSIDDINVSLLPGENFNLPHQISANTVDGRRIDIPVVWNGNSVDTSKLGVTTFQGTVSGYNRKVILNINVVDKEIMGNTTGNLSNNAFVAQSGDWVIFNNYKMKIDGSSKTQITQITQNWFTDLNFIGNWIYYSSNYIYKINIDGTGLKKVCNDEALYIRVVGDWIYYVNLSDNSKLYKIRTSGLDRTKISDDTVNNFVVSDGWIYYINNSDRGTFYRITTDGTGKSQMSSEYAAYINISDGWVYYTPNNQIYKMKPDGTQKQATGIDAIPESWAVFNISGDSVYLYKNYALYKIKLDGSSTTVLDSDLSFNLVSSINVFGDWVYYRSDHYYRIKTDGTGKQLLQ